MVNDEILDIIIKDDNCGIIYGKNYILRPSILCRTITPKEINNDFINKNFPEYIDTEGFIAGLFDTLNKKDFDTINDIKFYFKLLEANINSFKKEKNNSIMYFEVGENNLWKYFPISPISSKEFNNLPEASKNKYISFEQLNNWTKLHLNQKIYNDIFYTDYTTEEMDKILRKNNMVIDLYDFEVGY